MTLEHPLVVRRGNPRAKPSAGTCQQCGTSQTVLKGKVAEHTRPIGQASVTTIDGPAWMKAAPVFVKDERILTQRCEGSKRPPKEIAEKSRERAKAKRVEQALASGYNAPAMLDAVLGRRTKILAEFDVEFGDDWRSKILDAALVIYRAKLNKPRVLKTTEWQTSKREHAVSCVFCGQLVVRVVVGAWMQMPQAIQRSLIDRHTLICALQIVIGIREPVAHGMAKATVADYAAALGPLFGDHPELRVKCPVCGAAPETVCFNLDYEDGIDPRRIANAKSYDPRGKILWSLEGAERPHEARLIAGRNAAA